MDQNARLEAQAHRNFAPKCFNKTWELIGQYEEEPSPALADKLVLNAATSLWHWCQRSDVTAINKSVGTWLLARAYAVVDRPQEARHWAKRSLDWAQEAGSKPFYEGYAHEAMARSYVHSDPKRAREALERAQASVREVDNDELGTLLVDDLKELEERLKRVQAPAMQ